MPKMLLLLLLMLLPKPLTQIDTNCLIVALLLYCIAQGKQHTICKSVVVSVVHENDLTLSK